jgi:hypothetical protein
MFSIYLVLAIGYNLISLVLVAKTGKSAAPTDPMTGIMFNWLYLFFISSFAVLILSFGIIKHLINYQESMYFSRFSWLSAITINIFGVCVLILIIVRAIFWT